MRIFTALALSSLALGLAAAGVHAAGPDDPGAPTPPARYSPVISGTKSYRPVEPLPWGDVNRRVTPPAGKAGEAAAKGKAPESKQPEQQHKH